MGKGFVVVVEDDRDHVRLFLVHLHAVGDGQAGHAALDDDVAAGAHGVQRLAPLSLGMGVQDGRAGLLAKRASSAMASGVRG